MTDYEAAWKTAQVTIKFASQEINKLEQQNAMLVEVCRILVKSSIDDEPNWKDGDPIFAEDCVFDAYEKAQQALAQVGGE